jgi:hypothetical protein
MGANRSFRSRFWVGQARNIDSFDGNVRGREDHLARCESMQMQEALWAMHDPGADRLPRLWLSVPP